MPVSHQIPVRGVCRMVNESAVGYVQALQAVTADVYGVDSTANSYIGYRYSSANSLWTSNHLLLRLDLRRYRGGKATDITFRLRENQTVVSGGGALSDIELRAHARVNRTGTYNLNDHYTPAEMGGATLYASYSGLTAGELNRLLDFTNNGSELIDAVNAALDGDGIIDFILCLASTRTETIPLANNSENILIYDCGNLAVSPTPLEPTFLIDIEVEKDFIYPAQTSEDIFTAFDTGNWTAILSGTSPQFSTTPSNAQIIGCYNEEAGTLQSYELLTRFNLASIDTEKSITAAWLTLLLSQSPYIGPQSRPWHIRRYDWLGTPSAAAYRNQTQLGNLEKIAEFDMGDISTNAGFPLDWSDEGLVYEYLIDGGQALVDICAEGSSNTGFIFHSERMITGEAFNEDNDEGDYFSVAMASDDNAGNVASQLIVVYDDGSLGFFGGVF